MTTALIIVGVIFVLAIVVYFVSETEWAQRIWDEWFKDSETIFWARFQVAAGFLWGIVDFVMAVLPSLNPISWFDAGLTLVQRLVLAGTAIANGLWTEYLRRRRATDL